MTKNKFFIKIFILVISISLLIFPKKDLSDIIRFKPVPGKNLHNVKIHDKNGKNIYTISDLSYEKNSVPYITDIVLSFNYPSERLWQDDSKKYKIKHSDYIFIQGHGSLGKGCAKFFKKTHRIEIETEKNLWLGSNNDLGSFTIEFRFLPHSLRDGAILFSRVGYFSGDKRGIEILIKKGKINTSLYGIFKRSDGYLVNKHLKKGSSLNKGKWYHFLLSYDRISGKLAKYINGEEDEVVYITESGQPFNGVFPPSFGYRDSIDRDKKGNPISLNKNKKDDSGKGNLVCIDAPSAIVGKNFSGYIDEFRISYRHFDDLKLRTEIAYNNYKALGVTGRLPFNFSGIITSPVYAFPDTGTKVTLFKWNEKIKQDTFIWMEFRIYDHLFYENDADLKWYRVKNNQRKIYLKKTSGGDLLRGKYYQWRAHLIPSPDGKNSPSIYDLQLNYRLDPPPDPPIFLEVIEAGDEFVRIKWKKNIGSDIYGYRIYYGIIGKKYDGIISRINGKILTNMINNSNYIEVRITNETIDENRKLDSRKLLSFPNLKNTVLYFFSVSAYDSYKPGSPYNHESELSKQVTARPFAGSEID